MKPRKCDIVFISKVFEDVNEAVRYCDLLQGGGKGCEGVAEIEASSVRLSDKAIISLHCCLKHLK